ncbi:MAG TPA: tetratricopeptide repeat protein [Planctomycetota bacterium]|nr:tetratricopeptide repeat protein [Planctomycetota bacterium]
MNKAALCSIAAILLAAAAVRAEEMPQPLTEPPVEKNPSLTRYYAELATIHQRYKVYDKAEECLKKAIELEQNAAACADYAYQLGRLYVEWEKPDEAEMMFEFSIEQTPESGSALINRCRELAHVYEANQQFDKAEAIYRRTLQKVNGPVRQTVERDYYQLARKSGSLPAIIAEKEKELAKDPKDIRLLSSLSYLYRLSGDRQKEIGTYQAMVDQNPNDPQALAQMAVAYRDADDNPNAIKTYQKLIQVNPIARPYYVTEIAKLYVRDGKQKEADEWIAQLTDEKELATASGRARLARLYQETGAYDKSIEHYSIAADLAADPMQRDHYRLQLARVLMMARKLDDAEAVCKKLIAEAKSASTQQEARSVLARIKIEREQKGQPEPPRQ